MHDGKLYISMNDAVALALENNLDIAIARYNLNIADTDVWRAKAGASILGVNNGVVQNTPGGGVGGLGGQVGSGQGGTSVAAGGAGAGVRAAWSVNLSAAARSSPASTPSSRARCNSTAQHQLHQPFCGSSQNTTTGNFAYTQGFQWGTNLSVGFNNTRQTIQQ
jgi:outer membrane protein